MRRIPAVTALSVAGVLLAAGSAAALNSAVLGASGPKPQGAASSFVTLDEQPQPTPSATPSLAPTPSAGSPSAEARETTGAAPGSTRTAQGERISVRPASSASSTKPRSRPTSERSGSTKRSTPRPTRSSDDHGDDDSHHSSDDDRSGSPTGSGSGGHGSDDGTPDDD